MKKNKLTVIIPTINRQKDLSKALVSILDNTCLPDELIVVEQGNIKKTKKLVDDLHIKNKIKTKIIYSNKASLVHARNIGARETAGDIMVFLDDDVILSKDYFANLLQIIERYPDVKIFAGVFDMSNVSVLRMIIYRLTGTLFCVSSPFTRRNVVLPSGHNILRAHNTKKAMYVEWVSGLNMIVKKEVLESGVRFYEGFIKYSLGEDVFFTYNVFRKYGNKSILVHPKLRLVHSYSQEGRLHSEQLLKMRIIYKYIFWKKLVKRNSFYSVCYVLSEIFLSVFYAMRGKQKMRSIKTTIKAYYYLIKYRKDILNRKVDYNEFILDGSL